MQSYSSQNEKISVDIYKLQSVVEIFNQASNLAEYGREVLTLPKGVENNDIESFFEICSVKQFTELLIKQLDLFKGLRGNYFINVPLSIIANHDSDWVVKKLMGSGLNIEIQDSYDIRQLTEAEFNVLSNNISMLQATNVNVWLDDVGAEHLFLAEKLNVFGVKLDKLVFWFAPDIKNLVRAYQDQNIKVIVEGVQTLELLEKAISSGADLMQGFFWPETTISEDARIV
ncbi:EAL domain-containing protein [Vibrio mediterranei]|uniref:EAL domain-containing protein n=1 Tax=Vibrio mediterranei TaxID=689 RepID=UPI001EFD2018|nr:EAL domain-containing protein [Vibrio mediterranei]MCG9662201.1 EAL domain-containing protein [Vibrio mediterranei]